MEFGLLGEKLSHSYSPQIHGQLGTYTYGLFEKKTEELDDFLSKGNFQGLNVTIPYKKAVIPYCRNLSPQAEMLGAVNTIVRQADGTLLGHNSDYFGFQSMAARVNVDYEGKKVLVLGSGGASNTACAVMRQLGANVVIISRSGQNNYSNLHLHADCAVIVNTTPVGMYPNTGISPVDLTLFPKLEAVLDLIYNPAKTKLLLDAEALGVKTENGLWMLVAQAKESAQWFTGHIISDSVIPIIHKRLRQQMENIILVGMPGCGKTTNGKLLAEILGKNFIDIDSEIVKAANCSIPEIFASQGELAFRKLETEALACFGKGSGLVISTGGGCVTRPENLQLLHQNGTVIWLKRQVDQLPTKGRPLSQSNDLQRMYQVRKPLYEQFSHYEVTCGETPQETTTMILALLDQEVYG